MRIAFCLHKRSPYSGLSRDMEKIAALADARGHQITVLAREWRGAPPAYGSLELLPAGGLSNHARATNFARAAAARLAAGTFDVSLGFNKMPGLDVYFAADECFALHASRHVHLYRYTPRARSLARLEAGVFGWPYECHVLVLGERARLDYQEYYGTPDDRFRLLPPNMEARHVNTALSSAGRQKLRRELGTGERDTLLLTVGSGFVTKGVDRAIRALAALPPALQSRTRLAVAGDGNPDPLRRLATQLRIADRVQFIGGRGDVAQLLRAGDLLLHPARRELAGIVLLEALAAGLPVLTTDVCGYAHHVVDAGAGETLAAPFTQHLLDKALASLLADAGRRRELGLNGRRYATTRDLAAMPATAVDVIEAIGRGELRPTPAAGKGVGFLYLREDLRAALPTGRDSFAALMRSEGQLFRRAPGRRTMRLKLGARGYFIKLHEGVGWGEIVKNLCYLRLPVIGASNEWHAMHHLRRLGIETAGIAGFGQNGASPARRQSFIISDEVTNAVSLEDYCGSPGQLPPGKVRHKRELIGRVALIARTMHRNGINHRDLYLCHLWLRLSRRGDGGEPETSGMVVMDLHRAQIRRSTRRRWLIKDIAALYFSSMALALTQHDVYRFMCGYRAASLRQILAEDVDFWRAVERRAIRLWRRETRGGKAAPNAPAGDRSLPHSSRR